MHKQYLEFSYHIEDLLFKGISVDSAGGLVGICLCVAVFTFIYETVKTLRQKLVSSLGKSSKDTTTTPRGDYHSETTMLVEMTHSQLFWRKLRIHALHALLYMLQVTMGYMLMLIIMSYNAWLAITVFAAAGISYYFYSTCILYRPSVVPVEVLSPREYE